MTIIVNNCMWSRNLNNEPKVSVKLCAAEDSALSISVVSAGITQILIIAT